MSGEFLFYLAMTPFVIVGMFACVGVTLGLLSAVSRASELVVEKVVPKRLPTCDIDPRNHPAFVVRADGAAFIGPHEIRGLK